MIKIFNATDTDFSTNGNIVIKPLKCKERKRKSLNGWYIDVEVDIKYKDYIEQDKLCVVKTKSKLRPQAFRIENIKKQSRKISFTANHVMFDAKNYFLFDVRPTKQNGLNGLNYINGRTDNTSPFKIYSNVQAINTAYFIRKSLLEAWAIFEERWNGVFDADNWDISFLTKVGNDNGVTISYKKNMQGIQIFEDWSNVCTKICPVGYDGITLPEKYIESDISYEVPYTRTIDFETEIEETERTEAKLIDELRKNATKYLENNKYPMVSYEVTSNINQNMEIGDTIQVKHPLVLLQTEVLEYEHNILLDKIELLIFGNYTRNVKTKFDSIKESVKELSTKITNQESIIKRQTNLINTLNKTGYVFIDENEILILDKLPKEKAKNVWRFGLGGLGFSSNGYEGPFETAITIDGQINAKFITAGEMSVDRITGLGNALASLEFSLAGIIETVKDNKKETDGTLKDLETKVTKTAEGIENNVTETLKSYSTTDETNTKINNAKSEAIDTAGTNTDNKLENYSTITEMNTQMQQTSKKFLQTVGETYIKKTDFEELESRTNTKFEQTTKDFLFQFENITKSITNLSDATTEELNIISKFIRFIDGNIVLGQTLNELTLKISSDKIAFLQGSQEVAYFSNNMLYITDGKFLNSLTIGNFSFIPRSNGSLDFRKTGG